MRIPHQRLARLSRGIAGLGLAVLLCGAAWAQVTTLPDPDRARGAETAGPDAGAATGPIVLRPPRTTPADTAALAARGPSPEVFRDRVAPPSEFERFVRQLAGVQEGDAHTIRRFGSELVTGRFDGPADGLSPVVPADYPVAHGDEVLVTLWGSVVADLRLVVDRAGRISIPRVGAVQVAGVRQADLASVIERRVAQVFRNFEISVSLGQLRSSRVFVTGFVSRPGTYTVGALSTVLSALMQAGGPAASGSFRQVELRRSGSPVVRFDLYDLLLMGDRSADRVLQPGDVVHVGPVGTEVALIGSVNHPAIFEVKAGENVADVLAMAGGFSAVADRTRLSVERLVDRASVRVRELRLPADAQNALASGDVLRAFSAVEASLPVERQNKRVVVEGEVKNPGEYLLPPASSIRDAIRAAGGLTPAAYIFSTEFTRESVRRTQEVNYDRALRDLETEFTRATATQRTATAEEVAAQTARGTATERLIARLRGIRPTGRVVLQIAPDAVELPDFALEDGDRIRIPPVATTVGVFGSVFNGGSYLFSSGRPLDDYLRLAGGPTRGADSESVFVIRANGSVVSARQSNGGWFTSNSALAGLTALPGDTIFVPEEMNKTTFLQNAKDWTQILSQFALGVAAIRVLGN